MHQIRPHSFEQWCHFVIGLKYNSYDGDFYGS